MIKNGYRVRSRRATCWHRYGDRGRRSQRRAQSRGYRRISCQQAHDKLSSAVGPPSNSSSDAVFFAWAKAKGLTPQDIGCSAFSGACHYNTSYALAESNAALFYHSQLFSNDFGIDSPYKNATATITEMLPNALAGANYAPTACKKADWSCMSYLPETFKWIRAFRAGTFTLPFTEDYIFQQPPGSQQMYTLVIDVERAAVRAPPPSTTARSLVPVASRRLTTSTQRQHPSATPADRRVTPSPTRRRHRQRQPRVRSFVRSSPCDERPPVRCSARLSHS